MKNLMTTIGFLAFSSTALAGGPPVMFSNCDRQVPIKSPVNSSGIYYSEDCSTVYVLPPLFGSLQLSQPTLTANTDMCTLQRDAMRAVEAKSTSLNKVLKKIEELESKVTWRPEDDPWISNPDDTDKEDSSFEDPTESPEIKALDKYRDMAIADTLKILSFNEQLGSIEGPTLRLTMSMDHQALINEYQALNPGVFFQAMPLMKSVLTFIAKSERNIGKAPAAIYWSVAGIKTAPQLFAGFTLDDSQKFKEAVGNAVDDNQSILFSTAVSGQIKLSLIGACPFYDHVKKTMPETLNTKTLSPYLVSTADYAYQVQVNRSYEASYNMAELFKRIQKQSKKGGFFTSKTIHSLVIEKDSKGWFKFKSLSEDQRHEWDEALAQTVKAELIERALKKIGVDPVGKAEMPGIIAPGKSGASQIANGISKCPHIYCQAGAFVLSGLDSVFGRSSAIAEFISKNNTWESETVTEKKMVPQFSQLGFKD